MNAYVEACKYLVKHRSTIRDSASKFGIAKSSLHRYIHKNLYSYCLIHDCTDLFLDTFNQIYLNQAEKHIRGGNATKKVYENRKSNKK